MTYDAFVTKLNADGTALVYSTYLGGNGYDIGTSIAVDGAGQAYVAGETQSTNFPTTPGALPHHARRRAGRVRLEARRDGFGAALLDLPRRQRLRVRRRASRSAAATKFTSAGGRTRRTTPSRRAPSRRSRSAITSTREGRLHHEAVGDAGRGADLLHLPRRQRRRLGGRSRRRLRARRFGLRHGAHHLDQLPHHAERVPARLAWNGSTYDAFVTRLNSAGTALVFSTYFGGFGNEYGFAIAVDGGGAAYVAGLTNSRFLRHAGRVPDDLRRRQQPRRGHYYDAFVAKFSPDGEQPPLLDVPRRLRRRQGERHRRGRAGQRLRGRRDQLAQLPRHPRRLADELRRRLLRRLLRQAERRGRRPCSYGTYLGGNDWDQAKGIALDASGDVYLTGNTYSADFVTTPGAAQPESDGGSDAFITKIALGAQDYNVSGRVTNQHGIGLGDVEVSVSGRRQQDGAHGRRRLLQSQRPPPGREGHAHGEPLRVRLRPAAGRPLSNLGQNETVNFSGATPPLLIRGRVVSELRPGRAPCPSRSRPAPPTTPPTPTSTTAPTPSSCRRAALHRHARPRPGVRVRAVEPERQRDRRRPDSRLRRAALAALIGHVADEYNGGLANIRVTLSGPSLPQPLVQTTDNWGYFYFVHLEYGASYTVTASDPANVTARSAPAAHSIPSMQQWEFVHFTALPPLAIHGRVTDANSSPVTGVVTLTGGANAETQVDEWGFFTFNDLPRGGDYTVTVTKPGSLYTFSPPSRTSANLQEASVRRVHGAAAPAHHGSHCRPEQQRVARHRHAQRHRQQRQCRPTSGAATPSKSCRAAATTPSRPPTRTTRSRRRVAA